MFKAPTAEEIRVVLSDRRQRFFAVIRQASKMTVPDLVRVIGMKDAYTPLARNAALRVLASAAPIEVTQGRCYLERRRLVRAHYQV